MKTPDIASFAKRKNWTYAEVAEMLNKSTSFVGSIASGKSSVSYDTLLDLIKLGINANELFGEYADLLVKNSQGFAGKEDIIIEKVFQKLMDKLRKL